MTIEQETIAEKVIQLHKDNNGVYDWKDFTTIFNTSHTTRLIVARALRDKDIIGDHVTGTRLKEYGWTFKGFENERQSADKQRNLSEEKDKYDILSKKWIYKTRLIPYLVSFGALFFSVFSYVMRDKEQVDLQPLKNEIKELREKVDKQDSLFGVDTLLIKSKKRK